MNGSGLKLVLRGAALVVALTGLALTPALAQGARAPIAQMSVGDAAISWSPAAAHDLLVLRVSGPEGLVITRQFAGGESPSFSIFTEAGNALPDGSYTWELWVERQLSRGEQEAMMATRDQAGPRPERQVQSGYFAVRGGAFVDPAATEEMPMRARAAQRPGAGEGGGSAGPGLSTRDQVILDDLIVDGSICVGFDCVNGESFGFDTIRLKENNLRIKFQDTSTGSFPTVDWQLTANDSASGGANRFSIDDIDAGRTPFTIEASAPSHSLYVDDGGRVGLGTSTPVVELHVKDGDSPALRLEQDGSSGFTPQTWDVAGNETNFFVRDVTNGSTLPLRIRPSAPSNSIYIDTDGDVGVGTSSPDDNLHIEDSGSSFPADHATLRLEQTTVAAGWNIRANGSTGAMEIFDDTASGSAFKLQQGAANNSFVVAAAGPSGEVRVGIGDTTPSGELDVNGAIYQRGAVLHADYVFEPGYVLPSLDEQGAFIEQNRHLPAVPPRQVDEQGREVVEIGAHRRGILEELEKAHLYIQQLYETVKDRDAVISELTERLARLEVKASGES